MSAIFFQAVGKPIRAVAASIIRDIFCFIPLVLIFPAVFGGVEAILYAAPLADFIAMLVAAVLTITFMKTLNTTPEEEI